MRVIKPDVKRSDSERPAFANALDRIQKFRAGNSAAPAHFLHVGCVYP